jgi:membrane protease YdiL (CAAX protease family)
MTDGPNSAAVRTTRLALLFEGGLGALALLIGWLLGHWPAIGIDVSRWTTLSAAAPQLAAAAYGLLATAPLLAALYLIDRFPVGPLRGLRQLAEELIPRMFAGASVLQLALVSLAAGAGEELLFRGLVQAGLSGWIGEPYGPWIALAAASALFGVCHWLNSTYAAAAALAGLYFGLLLWLTGSLWTPLVAHASYDFLALLYLIRPNHLLGSGV